MMTWRMLHPDMTPEHLGLIPHFLDEDDPRSAKEQLDANYQHGGGWQPIPGFTMDPDCTLHHTGDPPFEPLAKLQFRDQTIVFYRFSFVAVIERDGSFEVSRMD